MQFNSLKPAKGAKKSPKRVGRGGGSGLGKTCGLGHKGQRARAGGYHKVGFEGGQMPLQRRVPKFGFNSLHTAHRATVRLHELNNIKADRISLEELRQANIITHQIQRAKVILSGKITKAVTLVGLQVTAGAKQAIEAAGGRVEA